MTITMLMKLLEINMVANNSLGLDFSLIIRWDDLALSCSSSESSPGEIEKKAISDRDIKPDSTSKIPILIMPMLKGSMAIKGKNEMGIKLDSPGSGSGSKIKDQLVHKCNTVPILKCLER